MTGLVDLVGARKTVEKARIFAFCLACSACAVEAFAQAAGSAAKQPPSAPAATAKPSPAAAAPVLPAGVAPPNGYVIGPDDQLSIVYWREKDLSADVVVRPDGLISLPLLNDVKASGLTPEQLRVAITQGASKFVEEPTVSVVVKAINSRKVFITGMVGKPGAYALAGNMTVLQLISMAGGLSEYANPKKIRILRGAAGNQQSLAFNYKDVAGGNNLEQNIELKPGDTVVVP